MYEPKSLLGFRAGIAWASFIVLGIVACDNPQPPAPCGPLPQVTVNAGESTTVTACFNDPNGDMLTYSATSSNPGVATASISGTSTTVTAVAPGNTSVTITASDPEGLKGQQSFQVMVPNRPPQPRGTIPAVSVPVGRTGTVDASSYFTEPDGEALTYGATSSNPAVATVTASGSTVTVMAVAKGTSNVTVTATDPGGLTATQTFQSTVPNRDPEPVGTIPDQTVEVDETTTIDLTPFFEDPDGDPLTYAVASSRSAVARGSVSRSTLTVSAVAPGMATLTVTARDNDGASVTQRFDVTVPQPNRAPRRVGTIPAQTLAPDGRTTIDASRYFSDPDGDALRYTATSSNSGVARASVSGSTVTITAVATGSATITVTARDPDELTATQTVRVTVGTAGAPDLEVPTVTPTSVTGSPGDTVRATFTIRNSGTAASAATTVRVLISSDANISRSDREIGDFRLRAMPASETLTSRRGLILGNTEGTRYWGLCIDAVSGESDTRNNCSRGVRVTTAGTPSACTNDLGTILDGRTVRRTGSWDGSCPSVHYSNGEFARYYSFTLRERLSARIDLTSPSVDTWLALRRGGGTGTGFIESDDDGGTGTNARIVRTLAPGTYTIEATTLLGGRTGPFTLTLAVGGGSSGADLVFTGVSPRTQTVPRGDTVRATFTIRNDGAVASTATTVRFFASENSTISTSDTELGNGISIPAIAAMTEADLRVWWTLASNAPLITVYWGLCVDPVAGESDTSNNCSESVRLTITASSSQSSTKAVPTGSADALLRSLTRSNIELQGAMPRIEPVHVPKDTRTKGTRPRSDSDVEIGRSSWGQGARAAPQA